MDILLNKNFMRFAGGTLENFRQKCTRNYAEREVALAYVSILPESEA
jgi:hypothetical protein